MTWLESINMYRRDIQNDVAELKDIAQSLKRCGNSELAEKLDDIAFSINAHQHCIGCAVDEKIDGDINKSTESMKEFIIALTVRTE